MLKYNISLKPGPKASAIANPNRNPKLTRVKSKSGGKSRSVEPLFIEGNLVEGSRKTSKNEWAHASRGLKLIFISTYCSRYITHVILAVGLYSSNFEHRAMASVDVLGLNTLLHGCALIIGNLNSFKRYKNIDF